MEEVFRRYPIGVTKEKCKKLITNLLHFYFYDFAPRLHH